MGKKGAKFKGLRKSPIRKRQLALSIASMTVLAAVVGSLIVLGGPKPESASNEKWETFGLTQGDNRKIIIGENEIVLILENVESENRARVTYVIGGETKTEEFEPDDVVVSFPDARVVLTFASDSTVSVGFKVSGYNFQILEESAYIWMEGDITSVWAPHPIFRPAIETENDQRYELEYLPEIFSDSITIERWRELENDWHSFYGQKTARVKGYLYFSVALGSKRGIAVVDYEIL